MKRLFFIQVLLIATVRLFPNEGTAVERYNEGVKLYSEGAFDQSLTVWLSLIDSGYTSPELYYNIGNAAFKTGKIPEAILFYEKALLSRPFDEDVRYNLEIARSYAVDRFNSIPELFVARWFRMISLMMSSNSWAIASLTAFFVFLLLLLVYLFSASVGVKKTAFIAATVFLLLSFTAISMSFQNRSVTVRNRSAIIFAPAVTGRSSPDFSGKELFIIHEGTKVEIEDEVGGWYEIRLSDGNVGWIQVSDAEKI